MFKIFNKRKKEEPNINEPSQEAIFTIHLKDGNLDLFVDWTDDLDIRQIGSLLGSFATPHLFNIFYGAVIKYLNEVGGPEFVNQAQPIIDHEIITKMELHKVEKGEDEPIVSPENAVRHLMTMYQS